MYTAFQKFTSMKFVNIDVNAPTPSLEIAIHD